MGKEQCIAAALRHRAGGLRLHPQQLSFTKDDTWHVRWQLFASYSYPNFRPTNATVAPTHRRFSSKASFCESVDTQGDELAKATWEDNLPESDVWLAPSDESDAEKQASRHDGHQPCHVWSQATDSRPSLAKRPNSDVLAKNLRLAMNDIVADLSSYAQQQAHWMNDESRPTTRDISLLYSTSRSLPQAITAYQRALKLRLGLGEATLMLDRKKANVGSIFRLVVHHLYVVDEFLVELAVLPHEQIRLLLPHHHHGPEKIKMRFRAFARKSRTHRSKLFKAITVPLDMKASILHESPLLEYWLANQASQNPEEAYLYHDTAPLRNCLLTLREVLSPSFNRRIATRSAKSKPQPSEIMEDIQERFDLLEGIILGADDGPSDLVKLLCEADAMFARRAKIKAQGTTIKQQDRPRGQTHQAAMPQLDIKLDQFIRRQKIIALANIQPGPLTEAFRRLAEAIGWEPPKKYGHLYQAALPKQPATPNLHDQSTRTSGTAAFRGVCSMTDNIESGQNAKENTLLASPRNPAVLPIRYVNSSSTRSRSLMNSQSSSKETIPIRRITGHHGLSVRRISSDDSPVDAVTMLSPYTSVNGNAPESPSAHTPDWSIWTPSHGISFKPSKTLSSQMVSPIMQEPGPAINDEIPPEEEDAGANAGELPALKLSTSDVSPSSQEVEDSDDRYEHLSYQIPEAKLVEARQAPEDSPLSYWSYDKYRSSDGKSVTMHYCKTKETSERIAQLFVGRPVIGCDIEWKFERKSSTKNSDSIKNNLSLIQIACEERVGLFQIALHTGEKPEDLLAPTLKQILESPDVLKCGVAISGDFTRMQRYLGIQPVSLFELSHLHRLVEYGVTHRNLVNRRLVSLAEQAKLHLGLPLYKGEERTSDWSQALNMNQCKYAADDAYASYRIFEALKEKWYALDPRPPFPAWAELGLPIQLAPLPANESASETSASEEESSVGELEFGAELESLGAGINDLVLSESDDDAASDDSYGSNLFDELAGEDIARLEDVSISKPIVAERARGYSALVSELDITESNNLSPGRLGLQPRLRTVSGRQHRPPTSMPGLPSLDSDAEQDWDIDEDLLKAQTDPKATSSADRALFTEASRWAEDACKTTASLKLSHARAYYLWEHQQMKISDIAALLRDKPLKTATVVLYIAECIQNSQTSGGMSVTDLQRVRELSRQIPRQARARYWRLYKMAEEV